MLGKKPGLLNRAKCLIYWWVLTGSNRRHSPCKGDALPTELSTHSGFDVQSNEARQFTASLRPLPARNFGTFAALILMSLPVRGLRPVRAARSPT